MNMYSTGALALITGALFSALAAFAHLACIAIGARAYRFMGAGERMAKGSEAGMIKPTLITLGIAVVLFVWAAFALSGAGVIVHLPFTKLALLAICCIYFGRAFGFPLIKSAFPENSNRFWLVSSSICLLIALAHAYGIFASWDRL